MAKWTSSLTGGLQSPKCKTGVPTYFAGERRTTITLLVQKNTRNCLSTEEMVWKCHSEVLERYEYQRKEAEILRRQSQVGADPSGYNILLHSISHGFLRVSKIRIFTSNIFTKKNHPTLTFVTTAEKMKFPWEWRQKILRCREVGIHGLICHTSLQYLPFIYIYTCSQKCRNNNILTKQ